MLKREEILRELWRRMTEVDGIVYTARNPENPPSIDDIPCVTLFEMDDRVDKTDKRGGKPIYFRRLQVVLETFIKGTSDGKASGELMTHLEKVKVKLYEDGSNLGGLAHVEETEASRILRPDIGSHVIGVGIVLDILYTEDVSTIT